MKETTTYDYWISTQVQVVLKYITLLSKYELCDEMIFEMTEHKQTSTQIHRENIFIAEREEKFSYGLPQVNIWVWVNCYSPHEENAGKTPFSNEAMPL